MSCRFNMRRSNKTTREIKKLECIKCIIHHYSDKRSRNRNRHKIGMMLSNKLTAKESLGEVQKVINKYFPESIVILRSMSSDSLEIEWVSEKEIITNEMLNKIIEGGYKIDIVAGI